MAAQTSTSCLRNAGSPLTVGSIQKKALPRKKPGCWTFLERCKQDGIPLDWEIFQEGASTFCDEDGPLGKALFRSVHAVTGEAPRFEMCPGLLEIRFYAAQGMPAFAYGPGLLSVAHGPSEYVDLRRIVETAAIYVLTAIEMLGT